MGAHDFAEPATEAEARVCTLSSREEDIDAAQENHFALLSSVAPGPGVGNGDPDGPASPPSTKRGRVVSTVAGSDRESDHGCDRGGLHVDSQAQGQALSTIYDTGQCVQAAPQSAVFLGIERWLVKSPGTENGGTETGGARSCTAGTFLLGRTGAQLLKRRSRGHDR